MTEEEYQSEAVRKVADHLSRFFYVGTHIDNHESAYYERHAKEIVALVHEAEDADE